MATYMNNIIYSEKYYDDQYEYRHVILPKEMAKKLTGRTMSEIEWRSLGVQQSRGWVHYAIHKPEPHILLFRRPITSAPPAPESFKEEIPVVPAVRESGCIPRPAF